jgi:uncharacterized membrane protein YphA (DoxX/SURF4 family)
MDNTLHIEKTHTPFLRFILSPWLQHIIRFSIGVIFMYAGITKIIDPKAFARVISQYDLVPESLLVPVAIGLPVLEILAGIGLFFAIRGSLSVIFGLLVMFIFVLWYGILKNLDIDCGCFSPQELKSQASLWHAFYRDAAMIAATAYLFIAGWLSDNKINLSFRTKIKLHLRRT